MADTKIIVNCETGEVQEIELTKAEQTQREKDAKAYEAAKAAEEEAAIAKAEARDAVLAKLGLTADEVAALLG